MHASVHVRSILAYGTRMSGHDRFADFWGNSTGNLLRVCIVGAQAPRRGFVGRLPMSAGCVIPQIVRHIATSPFPGDCFLSAASRTFEEPFASVFWTPEDGAELVLLHVTEDMVWVREYFEPSVNPGGEVRVPRIGVARIHYQGQLGESPFLGIATGSIVVSCCTGRPHEQLPLFGWYPRRPLHWPAGYVYWTVKWISFAPDI